MWKSTLRFLAASKLCCISTLAQFTSIACFAFLSAPMNARPLSVMVQNKVEQTELEDKDVLSSSDSNKQSSMNLLIRLAVEQVLADDKFLGKTRFSVDRQGHTVFYDLRPVPFSLILSDADPYARALEALIRVESLRRDFRSVIPNEKFWLAPIDSIKQAVQRCVQDLETPQPNHDTPTNQQECSNNIGGQFDKLGGLIETYGSTHGLTLVQPAQARDPTAGYRVNVKIEPPRARVRLMTLLEYKKYQYFKTPKEQYQWSDLLDSENDMIGWYHYRAEWPQELNGPEEGDFEIKKPGTVTFKPAQK